MLSEEIATSTPCYLGIDDGYFDINLKRLNRNAKTALIGIVTCRDRFVDLFIDGISIDGLDGTVSASRIISRALALYPIYIVFFDGVTYAGFNVIDPRRLYSIFNTSLAVIFRHQLDLYKIFKALKKHFNDYKYRYSIIEQIYKQSLEVKINGTKIKIYTLGLPPKQITKHIEKTRKTYIEPYPLRAADRLASLIGRILMNKNI
jgi:endonuclease V-like protein UPF0215 family